ncbi:DUF4249 family protein [Neolewinella antarctica]|uniref:DUF4249 domain-containing protein n=1 Tax=Neolewinella antarctica TaxID=442734 RepID=A0ABX0XEC1_9BACT|nr:DUF4249 family protein [Neolewinella antarctica]NJC27655.1 hypothetical protein [Neolewinella antarctica]
MRYLVLAAISALFFCSCGEDAFSTTVEIPFPEHDPLPVFTMDTRSEDSTLNFRVNLSRGLLEEPVSAEYRYDISFLRNGEVFFAREAVTINSSDGNPNKVRLNAPISGDVADYEVQVNFDGYEEMSARQTMPTKPFISNVSYEREGTVDFEGFRLDEIEFDLQDDPNTVDYYGFRAVNISRLFRLDCEPDTVAGQTPVCDTVAFDRYGSGLFHQSPDPTLRQSAGYGLVVSDAAFSGGQFRVRMAVENNNDADLTLEVYHLTEDAYRYGISRRAYVDAGVNPFAEPVNVHDNIEGGYGYFILANRIQVELVE